MPVKKKTVRNAPKLPKNVKINQKRKSQKKRGRRTSRRQRGGWDIPCDNMAYQFMNNLVIEVNRFGKREEFAKEIFKNSNYQDRVNELHSRLIKLTSPGYRVGDWINCMTDKSSKGEKKKCFFRDGTSFISGLNQDDHTKFYETLKLFIDKSETSSGLLGTKKTVNYTVTDPDCAA